MNNPHPCHPPIFSQTGRRQSWGQLQGAAAALALAEASRQFDGLTLIITPDTASAQQLEREIRFFVGAGLPVLHLADWETLPYDSISPHQDIISERLRTLYQLPTITQGLLVVPVTSLLQRLMPRDFLQRGALVLSTGDTLNIDTLRENLEKAGYRAVDTVYEHGEYAVRGALIDIFPMGSAAPLRIDLFDEEVDSLRLFDPDTQLTIKRIEHLELLPAHEYPLDQAGIRRFKQQWHEHFDVVPSHCPTYNDVSDGIAPPGIEYYLPLFYEQTDTLFNYLPEQTLVYSLGDVNEAAELFWQELQSRYNSRSGDITRPLLAPQALYLTSTELMTGLKRFNHTRIHAQPVSDAIGCHNFLAQPPPALPVRTQTESPLLALESFLLEFEGRVLFCTESAGRRESLLELLHGINIDPPTVDSWQSFAKSDHSIAITVAAVDRGLLTQSPALALISESQLFGERIQQQRRRRRQGQDSGDNIIKHLTELKIGAPVVHIDHGVGRYRGLETLSVDGEPSEFLMLEYAENTKLYVPVTSLHLISRYSGAEEAPLHRLGTEQWQKIKRKAAEQVRDTAAELLDIYARRAARQGYAFNDPKAAYQAFAAGFAFEETPDQQQTIEAVVADMLAAQPMDRLVCGDVGFGKTEVAMRAAFVAVHSGKQVAILAPTTLLAQQHYDSLKDRFADWPVTVEVISRFRSAKEVSQIKEKLAEGKIDIIVGTHKLIQPDIQYHDLRLLIIDEEHRFGVRQKEQLKKMRAEIDILALTATPIPRTLNMSMAGIRDLSIIATPPARRLSVKTFVRQHEEAIIREAVLREILRGGQVYYLHNEVKSIDRAAAELQRLVPEARIDIAHGQMRERELERVMSDFYHKRFNVIVCSTIIETGIDIPSANTIIIHRADKFGLAQLHQLRGRVGRSHHQAYAYLLTPEQRAMTGDATKRLEAIAEAQDLGAGFMLATHDMEIRGAGELLGDSQSGQIQSMGFSLYMEMLDRAVTAMRQGKTPNIEQPLESPTDVNLRLPALIPDDYLPDVHSRLVMYKRIASAESSSVLRELQVEMIDRFGLLPVAAKNLMQVTEIKLQAAALGIKKLEASAKGGRLEFSEDTCVDPFNLVQLMQREPQTYRLDGASALKFSLPLETAEARLAHIRELLRQLDTAPIEKTG